MSHETTRPSARVATLASGLKVRVSVMERETVETPDGPKQAYSVQYEGPDGTRRESDVRHFDQGDNLETAMQAVVFHAFGLIKKWEEKCTTHPSS